MSGIIAQNTLGNSGLIKSPEGGGAWTFIKKLTASSSSTLSFVDGSSDVVLDSTYKTYVFTCKDIHAATNVAEFTFQVSIDGGSNYNVAITSTAFEALHNEDGNGGALAYNTGDDQAQGTSYQNLCFDLGNGADESCAGILHLFNPASTTYVKHFYARFHGYHTSNYCIDNFVSGYFNTTSAINALQFKMTSGVHDGHYSMYGIK